LIGNIDDLPLAPEGYSHPYHGTTISAEIELSQRQANQYYNCEGVCYATTESRANKAYVDQTGKSVVDLTVSNRNIDHRLASSQAGVNSPLIGYGAGAPFARAGLGTTVDNKGVWSGQLQVGALLQVWNSTSTNVNSLMSSKNGGHSIIFRNYIYDNSGAITDFEYTDYHGGISKFNKDYYNRENTTILGVNLKDR
jgi:hypothetical protein